MRVSTPQQGVSGLGLAAQKEIVQRFLGNTLPIAEFIEVESGKRHKNRPQLQAALELCKKRKARLVIAKLDRLARNVAFISALMESDVDFVCCDNPHATRLMLHIMAAFAEHERDIISERIKATMGRIKAELTANGFRISHAGRRYTRLGNPQLESARLKAAEARRGLVPSERTLSFMLDLRAAGASFRRIAHELNRWDLRTGHGNKWHASTVRTQLSHLADRGNGLEDSSKPSSHLNDVYSQYIPSVPNPGAGRGFATEGEMPMPTNIPEGERMIDVFASVGAREFVVTKLDLNQDIRWAKTYTIRDLRDKLPAMMRTADERQAILTKNYDSVMAGENLIVRPKSPETTFIQLDDLKADQLERLRPASFLMLSTSPGNYQAWIAVSGIEKGESKEFVRRVRKACGQVDMSASGATRLSGTFNFKEKYAPAFPMVTITHAAPGRLMTAASLEQMTLLAPPEPEPIRQWTPPRTSYNPGRIWPSYEKCLAGAPLNSEGTGPDRSKADFTWAKFAAQRNFTIDEIAAELPNVSSRARERMRNDPGYVKVTAKNGYEAAMRGMQRARA